MAKFQTTVVFMVLNFTAGCGKNGFPADTDTEVTADAVAGADINANGETGVDTAEDDNGTSEDAFQPIYPDIAGMWTVSCQSDLTAEVNFNLNFSFFQDGTSIRGVEMEGEDAYCHGAVFDDGQTSFTMEEPCTGSTVVFAGNVASPSFMHGRYSWEWIDAYGTSHHDEGVWFANPSPGDCSPYPNIADGWTLAYENGRAESAAITVRQAENTFRGQGLDGCEYLGAFGLTPLCNDLRIYRRCPDLAGQTRVLFGVLDNPNRMSGSWYDMDDTFGCPEIKNGSWSADRP